MRNNSKSKPDDKHYIYKINCIVTNKSYIGETSNVQKRFKHHLNDGVNPNSYKQKYELYQDILKYGKECFNVEVLEECTYKDSVDREEYWIKYYNTYENGYNNAPRQNVTSLGYQYTEERKQYYSERFKGENNPFYGKKHSEETLEKLRKPKTQQQVDNLKKALKNRTYEGKCELCGASFVCKSGRGKYCSLECRNKVYAEKARLKRKNKKQ